LEKNRKTQIIEAAVKRFTKHGLNKTTLDEVARDLRIGKATIYHYFNSKDELYFAAIDYRINEFIEEVKKIFEDEDKPLEEKLIEYFELKSNFDINYLLVYELMLRVLKGDGLEDETNSIKNFLIGENELFNDLLKSNKSIKSENKNLPEFFVIQSWGFLFAQKLKKLSNAEQFETTKDTAQAILKNILN
jgi:AcrR family transcriptional regulator